MIAKSLYKVMRCKNKTFRVSYQTLRRWSRHSTQRRELQPPLQKPKRCPGQDAFSLERFQGQRTTPGRQKSPPDGRAKGATLQSLEVPKSGFLSIVPAQNGTTPQPEEAFSIQAESLILSQSCTRIPESKGPAFPRSPLRSQVTLAETFSQPPG